MATACGQGDSAADSPAVVHIVCDRDGTTKLDTSVVVAERDGVHVVVTNQLREPVSILGGLGFDASPGTSRWTLQIAPGDHAAGCWPYSEHGTNEPPTVPLEVTDPNRLYTPRPSLECSVDDQWTSVFDYYDFSEGATDPVEAVRGGIHGLRPTDSIAVGAWGYPDAPDDGGVSVVVERDENVVAIIGVSRGGNGRWVVAGGDGCSEAVDL
jgi:hypothetical protein